MANMLQLKNVTVSYKNVPTVQNFNLDMKQGQIVSLVGESGSGKTTVIRAVLGLLAGGGMVSGGSITFEGKDLLSYNREEWRNLRGSEISLIFHFSVFHNHDIFGHLRCDSEVMRHHDDTGSVIIAQFHHLAHDLCLCCHIQCGGRFVRKQQFRLIGHTHRDSHTLAHTTGKLERIGFHHVIRAWKIHFFQHPTAFFPGIFF